jgi:hypothetical protein
LLLKLSERALSLIIIIIYGDGVVGLFQPVEVALEKLKADLNTLALIIIHGRWGCGWLLGGGDMQLVFSLFLPCLIFTQLGKAVTVEKILQW